MLQIAIFFTVHVENTDMLMAGFPFDSGTEHKRGYSTDLKVSLVKNLLDASVEVIWNEFSCK